MATFYLGKPLMRQFGNLILIGNAMGAILPAMGFGLFPAILSGIDAAEAIMKNTKYEDRLIRHDREYQWSLALRNAMELLDNRQLDRLVDGLGTFLGKYLMKAGSVNFMRMSGRLLSAFIRETEESGPVMRHMEPFQGQTLYQQKEES